MKAVIFAAGLGTRLRPLTDNTPKALVEVAGQPMLKRVIEKLKASGVDYFIINVHHFADKIKSYLEENSNFGVKIIVSDESDHLLETGGGLLKIRELLDTDNEPFIVHNSDILTDFDITEMLSRHHDRKNDVTLMVNDRNSSRKLLFDHDLRLRAWTNLITGEIRPQGVDISAMSALSFGGVHIINPERFYPLLASYTSESKFSITPFYVDRFNELKINAYIPVDANYGWFDIGTIEKLRNAEAYLRNK
ncbi:MAG: nucleotidyltransferase family protein [Lachnoclostridium sp.]|nr:nucleotidyltransferase family protein [Lachnoclostridium sp.]